MHIRVAQRSRALEEYVNVKVYLLYCHHCMSLSKTAYSASPQWGKVVGPLPCPTAALQWGPMNHVATLYAYTCAIVAVHMNVKKYLKRDPTRI